ncbi:Imidazolonepropionase [Leminorella richardii]|uniref:Imidazolonepropionase n=1 Tax=Leminorella richardii TaxID=158841 RepID=A0A2X4Y049_9GAMM|nr:imidazolonepropionase [Leminorella richardii]SQI42154.1 Imidazolonepropionase [Leminorella richardii]
MAAEREASDVIWRNARLATMVENGKNPYGILDGYDLIVRGEKIQAVVPRGAVDDKGLTAIDVAGRLITPGLIDCHTHLVFGGNRANEWEQRLNGVSYAELSQQGGGINATVRATRLESEQQLLAISEQRLKALISEGVTTLEIKSGYGLDLASEEKQLRVAQRLGERYPVDISPTLLSAHTTPPEYRDNPDTYIDLICQTIMPQLWEKGLFESVDVFCESVGFSLAQSERLFNAAARLQIPVRGHVEQMSNIGGSELVARHGGLSVDHIEYLDEAGIAALSQQSTVAVLLPGAFYFLKEKRVPPVDLLRRYRVPMAVASDFNPGTSPFASLRLAMNMACVQFGLTVEEAWAGVTRHAAQALNRQNTHGQLAAGFYADFIVWEAEQPVDIVYELGRNLVSQRVFRGEVSHDSATLTGGQP